MSLIAAGNLEVGMSSMLPYLPVALEKYSTSWPLDAAMRFFTGSGSFGFSTTRSFGFGIERVYSRTTTLPGGGFGTAATGGAATGAGAGAAGTDAIASAARTSATGMRP